MLEEPSAMLASRDEDHRRMARLLLDHIAHRLDGLDDGDYIGPMLEIVDVVRPLHDGGRLVVAAESAAPGVAAAARLAAGFLADATGSDDALLAAPGWTDAGVRLAHALGYLAATTPEPALYVIDRLRGRLDGSNVPMELYLDAVRARIALFATPRTDVLDQLLPLAQRIRPFNVEYSWNFLFEALPPAYIRGGHDFVRHMLAEIPTFVTEDLPGIGKFRIWNVLALASMHVRDVAGAEHHLDLAARSLGDPAIAPTLRRHQLALIESNRSRVLLETTRHDDAYLAAVRALSVAPSTADRLGAVWHHAARGCRIAARMGRVVEWHNFLLEHVPLFPDGFEGDRFYNARKYAELAVDWVTRLAEAGKAKQSARLAAHALSQVERYLPTWYEQRDALRAAR
ncbi:hypothetical protein [Streptomyces sp. bgisy034]|uniref:hypothetical protein n=1 Tax=Streptomyces sp. bgisy034 TaxID=3413774 RepID=UPI003EBE1134